MVTVDQHADPCTLYTNMVQVSVLVPCKIKAMLIICREWYIMYSNLVCTLYRICMNIYTINKEFL